MFKESLVGVLPEDSMALLDSGYQGVNEYFPYALVPFKSTKKCPLTEEQKAFNTRLSKARVAIEHINRELKIFRICKETYRGKGKRGLLRVKLIASLFNRRIGF
jgi:transposase